MIGAKQFARMKPTAFFINTARGFIHDEKALEELLRAKKIAGAGLDVWDKEPPPTDHPLLKYDNVLASPHTAGVTREARANMGRIAAEQLLDALDGKRAAAPHQPARPGRSMRAVSSRSWGAGRRAAAANLRLGVGAAHLPVRWASQMPPITSARATAWNGANGSEISVTAITAANTGTRLTNTPARPGPIRSTPRR